MLDAMRRGAQTWLAKILFAILIVSFGIFWNVEDVFRGAGRGAIATVGDTEITVNEFQRAFQNQMRSLQMEGGGRLTTEQGLMLGIDRQALDRLVAQAAVRTHADRLGLSLSDEVLAEGIKTDPAFAGPDGRFSRLGFDGLLRQMGLNEAGFLAVRRDDEVRRQISDALIASTAVPKTMIDDLHAWRSETRTIEHFHIDPAKVSVAEPDDAKLKETYDARATQFMTPEYRKVALLALSADELKGEVQLTDDELKTYYQDHKATYDKAEQRRVQQIAFPTMEAAAKARTELVDAKKNFLDVAKEAGATESDVNLGMVAKTQLIDPKIADVAFSLERDAISEPVEGRFAIVLVRVIEISEGKESTFDDVKDRVRDKLAGDRAQGLIQDRFDLVEEGRNAGKTLEEIGAELKLKYVDVEAVTADNKTPDGKTAIDIPNATVALQTIFATPAGSDAEPVELPGDAFVWFDVLSVTERQPRPFDEVKDEVKKVYTETETSRLLDELAQKLVERLKSGEAFAKVAEDAGGKAEVSETIKRNASPPGLTTDAVRIAFALPKSGAGYSQTSDGASRIVFQVKDIVPAAAPSKEESDRLAKELAEERANDDIIAYVQALQSDLKVHINETELKRATGATVEE